MQGVLKIMVQLKRLLLHEKKIGKHGTKFSGGRSKEYKSENYRQNSITQLMLFFPSIYCISDIQWCVQVFGLYTIRISDIKRKINEINLYY